jgi:DNA helicase HerA-like ATPase
MKGRILLGMADGKDLYLPLSALKKHLISIGSTGSGKTVLSKVIVEEAALAGIPSIIIDPHGDLASLAIPAGRQALLDNNLDPDQAEKLKRIPVNIFTPESKTGIPLSVSPLEVRQGPSNEEKIGLVDQIASAMTTLLGYDLSSDRGSSTKGILYTVLMEKPFTHFQELISYLEDPNTQKKLKPLLSTESQIKDITRKLTLLTIGKSALLFESGYRLNLDEILAKPSINVVYLNTLNSQEEKDFFISILVKDIYEWMLHHPSKELQLLFLIDEIAPFIPAGASKPASKEILKMLFKQARKYGIGCIVATQNPGDIDYMAFSQFGSWAIGRLTTRQDQKKVEEALESISSEDISSLLPSLLPGNFVLFSPDNFASTVRFKARWLYTEHIAITETDIARLMAGKKERYHTEDKRYIPAQKKAMRAGREILCLRVKDPTGIIQKNLKHSLLRKAEEQVLSTRLELLPIYRLTVKRDARLLGVKISSVTSTVLASAIDGSLISRDMGEHSLAQLYRFSEDQLMVYELITRKNSISSEEIAYYLKVPAARARKILTSLTAIKAISYRKEGKRQRWYLVKEVSRTQLGRYDISGLGTEHYDGIADVAKARISEEEVGIVMKIWFSADITASSLIYLPCYRVVLQSRDAERTIRINGTNGRVF